MSRTSSPEIDICSTINYLVDIAKVVLVRAPEVADDGQAAPPTPAVPEPDRARRRAARPPLAVPDENSRP
jgi:hypothetical protein